MNEEFEQENREISENPQAAETGAYTNTGSNTYAYSYQPVRPVQASEPKKKKGTWARVLALVLCCVLLGGAAGIGGTVLMQKRLTAAQAPAETVSEETAAPEEIPQLQPAEESAAPAEGNTLLTGNRPSTVIHTASVETGKLMSASEVYAANVNSTVGISAESSTNYWGYSTPYAAAGSGFIISESGYILTNYHVIEGSRSVSVSTYDGKTYEAKVIGGDESNDIAVLKIEAEGLTPVILGDSDNMNVGDTVIAIGNPLGELTFSLSQGVISALNREVTLSGNQRMRLIQTDAAINSGNSGGALFNLYGEVIGITNAKYSSSSTSSSASIDNIGFAIPINSVFGIVESIIEKGVVTKPYIGVTVQTVSDEASIYAAAGARVVSVTEGSPAEEAGLQENDIITVVDGEEIATSTELVTVVTGKTPGDEVVLSVYRDRRTLEIRVVVGEQVTSAEVVSENTQEQQEYPYGYGYGYGNGSGNGNGFPYGFFGGGVG